MKAMEVTQDEIQEEMMVMNPKIRIKTFMANNIENHLRIQTRVEMMEDEDVEEDTTIKKWAKPLPKLDLPPRVHLQKASKVKQIWDCGQ